MKEIKKAVLPAINRENKGSKSSSNVKRRYVKSEAVRELERIADHAARLKYPEVPFLAPRKYRDDSANGLTKCIIAYIQLKGGQAERVANMGRQLDTRVTFQDVTGRIRTIGSKKWIPGTGTNGTADISATINGKSVKIEVKIGTDRQSQSQIAYQRAIESAGGLYYVAHSFDEIKRLIDML